MSVDIAEGHAGEGDRKPEKAIEETRAQAVRKPANKTRARIVQLLLVLVLFVVVFLVWRMFGGKPEKSANAARNAAVPVEIGTVVQKDFPIQIKAIGNVEALSTVSVRSQISGVILNVFFTPGQEVTKGAILFKIDPRPLQASLAQEESNLVKAIAAVKQGQSVIARDQATANNSRGIAKRDAELVETGVIARQDYDNAVSKALSDEASVRADQDSVNNLIAAQKAQQSVVENAKVQLGYTDIRANITGKTGNLTVTAGNLVNSGDQTALVTITQTSPIYVTFSIPQQQLDEIRKREGSSGFSVQCSTTGDEAHATFGRLSLVDNTVDMTTGTIKLKATFDNSDRKLFPGLFANVILTLGVETQATAVPSQAVQIGQDQTFVYVVKPDMTVEVRKIKTGDTLDNMTLVQEGLKPGEQVVTDGQLSLVPGAKVQAKGQGGGQGKGSGKRGAGGQTPADQSSNDDSGGGGQTNGQGTGSGQGSGSGQGTGNGQGGGNGQGSGSGQGSGGGKGSGSGAGSGRGGAGSGAGQGGAGGTGGGGGQ